MIREAGMAALPMIVEEEARFVASPIPDEEQVGWMNKIIEQLWERSVSPNVTPDLLNSQLVKIQRRLSEDNSKVSDMMARLVAKLKVVRLTLGSSPLVISRIEVDGGSNGILGLAYGFAYHGNGELVLQIDEPLEVYAVVRNLGSLSVSSGK